MKEERSTQIFVSSSETFEQPDINPSRAGWEKHFHIFKGV